MTSHEKECALAAYALLIERAKKQGQPTYELRKEYREIAAIICEDEAFPSTHIPG